LLWTFYHEPFLYVSIVGMILKHEMEYIFFNLFEIQKIVNGIIFRQISLLGLIKNMLSVVENTFSNMRNKIKDILICY